MLYFEAMWAHQAPMHDPPGIANALQADTVTF